MIPIREPYELRKTSGLCKILEGIFVMMQVGRQHRFRILWFCMVLLVVFLIVWFRLLWQGFTGQPRAEQVAQMSIQQQWLPARRGTIFDRHLQHRFAYGEEAYQLTVDKDLLPTGEKVDAFAEHLAPWLSMDAGILREQLQKKSRHILLRSSGSTYFSADVVDPLLRQKEAKQWPALSITMGVRRRYGPYASHVLGFIDGNGDPRGGVEAYYQKFLQGKDGWRHYTQTRQGVMIADAPQAEKNTVPGSHLVLTLDVSIQREVERILKEGMEKRRAKGGAAVVIDPHNGEILALASMPTFSSESYATTLDEVNQRNHLIHSIYEPGSVFKTISLAAIIEELGLDPDGSFLSQPVTIGNQTIHEWNRGGFGTITNRKAIEQSSNTFFVRKILQMTADRYAVYVRNFGIGDLLTGQGFRTGIDLLGEVAALMPPVPLTSGHLATTSFGQSIAITLLQQASAVAAIAQGGILYKPHLLKEVRDAQQCSWPKVCPVTHTYTTEGRRVIPESTAMQIRSLLEGVVKNGTGQKANIPEYEIAGKTGTGQKADPVHGGYMQGKSLVTFTGWAPAKQPDIAILVAFDEPEIEKEAASTTAEMVRQILPLRGVAPKTNLSPS